MVKDSFTVNNISFSINLSSNLSSNEMSIINSPIEERSTVEDKYTLHSHVS